MESPLYPANHNPTMWTNVVTVSAKHTASCRGGVLGCLAHRHASVKVHILHVQNELGQRHMLQPTRYMQCSATHL